jgi:hypothetical protein
MKQIYLFISLLIVSGVAEGQSPHWPLMPKLMMQPSGNITNMPGTYTAPYHAANCGYDNSGNIIFYIQDYTIYNALGVAVGNLSGSTMGLLFNSRNLIIIPDPGDCKARLVIHTEGTIIVGPGSCYFRTFLYCTRIISTGGSLTIQQNYSSATLTNLLSQCNMDVAMTVSKPVNGNRFLYLVDDTRVYKYLIDASGISLQQSFSVNSGSTPTDLELSPSGDKLAWSDVGRGIQWVSLDANGNFLTAHQLPVFYYAYGLEFIDNNRVMVAVGNGTNGGIYVANLTTLFTNQVINNVAFSKSQLEMALDGNIYAASASGLLKINPVSFSTALISLPMTSNAGFSASLSYYSLPKQLDAENYSQVFSCTPVCTGNITISGTYTVPLKESQTWIKSNGITIVPATAAVKLDADPVNGFIELNPGFEVRAGALFIARALDGCGPAIPM